MADRWMDERDREWRERDWRRSEQYGRGDQARRQEEERSWAGSADDDRGPYKQPGRDERDRRDDDYDRRSRVSSGGGAYGAGGSYGGGESYGRGGGRPQAYQSGQRRGGYGGSSLRFGSQDYTGGRAYRDEADRDGYRQEPRADYDLGYGEGGLEYARGYEAERGWRGRSGWESDGGRSYNRDIDRRYAEEMRHRASGGAGGDDYERGYGDAGRSERHGRAPWEERREEMRGGQRGGEAGDFLQRTGERISSWFRGGREERPMSADRGHRGIGPKDYKRSDERINEEVHERLTDDPWLDASNVKVEVHEGEVTLSGTVDNREAKHRAERLIEDLSGVKHVQNNLRVDPGASLTGAGRGFGSSALEAEMRRNEAATDPGNRGVSGLSGRTSTGAAAERSSGTASGEPTDPASGHKTQ